MRIVFLLALASTLLALPATAQDKSAAAPQPEPMRFVVTRSAEPCEPDCREWIAAQGAITKDTPAELRRALTDLNGRKLPLLVYSTGGTVEAAWDAFSRGSAIRRAKRAGFLRNVAVALGNWGAPEAVPALVRALEDAEPLVRGHAAWALGRIGGEAARFALSARLPGEPNGWVREELELALRC